VADQDADAVGIRWGDTGTAAGVRLSHGERGGPGDGHGEHGQDGKVAADGMVFMMVCFR
jgi:hypothetical protein